MTTTTRHDSSLCRDSASEFLYSFDQLLICKYLSDERTACMGLYICKFMPQMGGKNCCLIRSFLMIILALKFLLIRTGQACPRFLFQAATENDT